MMKRDIFQIKKDCKNEWDKTPALRAEFMDDFDGYVAYVVATEAGQVKVLKGGTN